MESAQTTAPPANGADPQVEPEPQAQQPQPEPEPSVPAGPSPGERADAARAEVKGDGERPTILEFTPKGENAKTLKLSLPKKLPFRALRFSRNDDEMSGSDIYLTLEAIVGWEQMRMIDNADLDVDEGQDLLNAVVDRLGMGLGESSASDSS